MQARTTVFISFVTQTSSYFSKSRKEEFHFYKVHMLVDSKDTEKYCNLSKENYFKFLIGHIVNDIFAKFHIYEPSSDNQLTI